MIVTKGSLYTLVTEATDSEIEKLTNVLTIKAHNFWFSKAFKRGLWDGSKCYLKYDGRSGLHYFLTGFLGKVSKELKVVVRERRKKSNIKLSPNLLKTKSMTGKYSYQYDAMIAAVEAKIGILSLATGAGKTSIAVALSTVLPTKVLFVVPTIDLMWQTYDSYAKDTDLKVGVLGDGERPDDSCDVVVAVYKSAQIVGSKHRGWLAQFKTVFIDECHHATSSDYIKILKGCTGAEYKFGMSGTPHAMDSEKVFTLTGYLGDIIHQVSGKYLSANQVNAVPNINIHELEMEGLDIPWPECYIEGVVENEIRNRIVVDTTCSAYKEGKTCLVLTKRQIHGEILRELFLSRGIDLPYLDSRSNKKERTEKLRELRAGKIQGMIISKIGEEGLDIPQLDFVFRASAGLSPISTIQALGRGLRGKSGKNNVVDYHDFYDKFGGSLEDHAAQRLNDYQKERYEIKRIIEKTK